jgi:putative tricarboxylic transport membrane protein
VPLVLGLVLGSIMVERLTAGASQITSATDLVSRPVSGVLASVILVIILASITAGIFGRYRRL